MNSDQVVVSDQSQETVFCRSCRGTGHASSECPVPILPSPHAMIEKQTNTYYRGTPSKNAQKNKELREKKLAKKAMKKQVKDEKKKERRMDRLETMNKKGGYPKGARIVRYNDSGDEDGISSRSDPSDSLRSRGDRRRGSGFKERELVNGYKEARCYKCNQVGHLKRDCRNYGRSNFGLNFKSSDRQDKANGNECRNDRALERQGRKGRQKKSRSQSSSWSTIDGRSSSPSSQVIEIVETEITAFQSDADWRLQEAEDQIQFMGRKIERLQEAFRQFQIRDEARQLEVIWLKKELNELKSKGGQKKNGKVVKQSKSIQEVGKNRPETDPNVAKGGKSRETDSNVAKSGRSRKAAKEIVTREGEVSTVEKKVPSPAAGNIPWDDLMVRKDDNERVSEEKQDVGGSRGIEESKSKKKSPFKKNQSEEGREGKKSRNKYRIKAGESESRAVNEQGNDEGLDRNGTASVNVQDIS